MRFSSRPWRRAGLAVAAAVGLTVVGASAYAAIPDPDGLIHGCYDTRVGVLRVIDPAKASCQSTETALSWNQRGTQGPKGDKGDKGDPGPSHLYLTHQPVGSDVFITTNTDVTVVSETLPTGTYLVQARIVAQNFSLKQAFGRCAVSHGAATRDDDADFTIPGVSSDAPDTTQSNVETLQASVTLTAPATLTLSCVKGVDVPDYLVQGTSLSALQVGALN